MLPSYNHAELVLFDKCLNFKLMNWVARIWAHKNHPFSALISAYHIINISSSFFFFFFPRSLSFQYFREKNKSVCIFFFFLTISAENLRTGLIEPTVLEKNEIGTDRNHIWFHRSIIINNTGSTLGHNYFSQCYWWLSLLPLSCTKVPLLYSSQNCNYLNSVCSFSLPHTPSSYYH